MADFSYPHIQDVMLDPYQNGDLEEWFCMQARLKELRDQEMALRKRIAKVLFPEYEGKEGTMNMLLPDGAKLTLGASLTRKLDVAMLQNLREEFEDNDISVDTLVEYEPKLKLHEYRALEDAQRIMFDQALEIKIGSPSMEIKMPKPKK